MRVPTSNSRKTEGFVRDFFIKGINMVRVRKNLTGKRFGRLEIIKQVEDYIDPTGVHKAKWLCNCECNTKKEIIGSSLKNGYTRSCGCLHREGTNYRHGYGSKNKEHSLYHKWLDMKQRCTNKRNRSYHNYGGRGITICKEWLNSPGTFIEWGLTNGWKEELIIDRKNNDGNYEPNNCRFVTHSVSAINQRIKKNNKSKYSGVWFEKKHKKWLAFITYKKKRTHLGSYANKQEAVTARNNYIMENNLPHNIQG